MLPSVANLLFMIVTAQVVLLVIGVPIALAARTARLSKPLAVLSSIAAAASLLIFLGAIAGFATIGLTDAAIYAAISVGLAVGQWLVGGLRAMRRAAADAKLQAPEVRNRAGEELREILRKEGIVLDQRLEGARQEREQFLYALEEQHARQIAGLAQEYQHESQAILRQLLDQLAADQLQPMVEQRLAEHMEQIESELGAIDSTSLGETLNTLTQQVRDLEAAIAVAEERIAEARDANPDAPLEVRIADRVERLVAQVDEHSAEIDGRAELAISEAVAKIDARINEVAAQIDEKVDAASNPLVIRMQQTEEAVGRRFDGYLDTIDQRFNDTERLLSDRIVDQERALEARVVAMESAIDERLQLHGSALENVLTEHDGDVRRMLDERMEEIRRESTSEREKLSRELVEQATLVQEGLARELEQAEATARATVEDVRGAWSGFVGELEERFAATREDAIAAARDIAERQKDELQRTMERIVQRTRSEIAEHAEALGREAAWQKEQVARTAQESTEILRTTAQRAIDDADTIFADLERIGQERVNEIRMEAESSLVQSRDYVEQLQVSLGDHLEQLRGRAGELADDLNNRLETITRTAHDTAMQVDEHCRNLQDSVTREISAIAEQQAQRIEQQVGASVGARVTEAAQQQQRQFEQFLAEQAQRIVQQVNGDIAGLAEQARSAVTGELEQLLAQSSEHARQAQEQSTMQLMGEIARQQQELADRARDAAQNTRGALDDSLHEQRRQLDAALASMGAHMREELVRFEDEGRRRIELAIEQLRAREQDMLREEDRRLAVARDELMRQHQNALESQVRNVVGGLTAGPGAATYRAAAPAAGFDRPATPLTGGMPATSAPADGFADPFAAQPIAPQGFGYTQ